jgi:hypothetical protein
MLYHWMSGAVGTYRASSLRAEDLRGRPSAGRTGRASLPAGLAAVVAAPRFRLPPATIGWVDYTGQLHVGDLATLAL